MARSDDLVKLTKTLAAAFHAVLRQADSDELTHPDEPIDAGDRHYLEDLPEGDKRKIFENLAKDIGMDGARESDHGLPQTAADVSAHQRISAILRSLRPDCVIVGEEAGERAWDEWADAPVGSPIFSLDAIDGTGLFDSVGFGHSANLLMLVRMPDGSDQLLMTLTVTATGWVLAYIHPGEVYVGTIRRTVRHWRHLTEPVRPLASVRQGFVAVVAAKPEHRAQAWPVLSTKMKWNLPPVRRSDGSIDSNPALTVITLGGAPAAIGLAALRLHALINLRPQTLHDAAPLVALAALGIGAFGTDGRQISPAKLIALFDKLGRPTGPDYTPIPAMTLSRTPELGALIARRLAGAAGLSVVRDETDG